MKRVWMFSLLLAVCALVAPAWAAQVKVCHLPPGNPANFHTITINENALSAHLAHGDQLGSCSEHCEDLCDDGDACTVDACDSSERCLLTHAPVSCDDGNLCTTDTCNSASGCGNTPVVCVDSDLCTVNSCDPLTGACVFPANSCPLGQACNPANGSCESSDPCASNACVHGTCQAAGSSYTCNCQSGWTGTFCEEDINECVVTPFICGHPFDATCHNTPGSYECNYI